MMVRPGYDVNRYPLVSCIMPTAGRPRLACQAIACFQAQDYPNKELIVIDDGDESVSNVIPDDPRIRYSRLENKNTVGAKRNLACRQAAGEILVHWDDDDWMADWRLSYQVDALLTSGAEVCGLSRLLFYDPVSSRSWQYVYPGAESRWVAGATLCYKKRFWSERPFAHVNVGEDTRFVLAARSSRIVSLQNNTFYVAMIHRRNTSPKQTDDSRYHPYPLDDLRAVLGRNASFYEEVFRDEAIRLRGECVEPD